jgi:hypothetical protein
VESRCGHVLIYMVWAKCAVGVGCVSGQKMFSGGFLYIGHIEILGFV